MSILALILSASALCQADPLTLSEALDLSLLCSTPTAWAERSGNGWRAVCGDSNGKEAR